MKIGTRYRAASTNPRSTHPQNVARADRVEVVLPAPGDQRRPRRDEWVFTAQGNEEDWAKLVAFTEQVRFKTGECVIKAGERDRALYFLTEGRLDIMLPQPKGADRLVRTISAPAVVGEMGFVEDQPALHDDQGHDRRRAAAAGLRGLRAHVGRPSRRSPRTCCSSWRASSRCACGGPRRRSPAAGSSRPARAFRRLSLRSPSSTTRAHRDRLDAASFPGGPA